MSELSGRRSWWRGNRWWLPTLPLTLALMLAAQSYRLEDLWWLGDLHRAAASGDQGEVVEVRDPGTDAMGDFTREFTVSLVGVSDVDGFRTGYTPKLESVPDGSRAVEVELAFEADADQLLSGCRLELLGDDGVRYGGEGFDPLGQGDLCVPANRSGPMNAYLEGQERIDDGKPRPPEWTVTWSAVVPVDAVLTEVRLSYEPPDYVALRIPPSS